MESLVIYTDGGSRGNPGSAAYGFVVYYQAEKIYEEGCEIGISTNNIAEYMGVLAALQWVDQQKKSDISIDFFMDSQLLAHQLSGTWKIKNLNLSKLFTAIKEIETRLHIKTTYTPIPREKNKAADRMVNLALDHKI